MPLATTVLRAVATAARRSGLTPMLDVGRSMLTAIDATCAMAGCPPVSAKTADVRLHGFLRQRAMLTSIATGRYESATVDLFRRALEPDMTVIDGGACLGFYSLLAAPRIGDGIVYAYEPDSQNFRALTLNVEASGQRNIRVSPAALSDQMGESVFYRHPGGQGSSLVNRAEHTRVHHESRCRTTTIDRELAGVPVRTLLVKLDVEGHEVAALRGMTDTLARARRVVLITEVNPGALANVGMAPMDQVREIEALGLTVQFVDDERGRGLVAPDDPRRRPKGNRYCVRG